MHKKDENKATRIAKGHTVLSAVSPRLFSTRRPIYRKARATKKCSDLNFPRPTLAKVRSLRGLYVCPV
ncbi:uncharacterized protein UBRO_20508 [Ustilago bromivora]|uniref:Uncharacterized protein n=1 Tax=Ustilago bromivora TaxID=307758 RepID=A0A1K0FYX7_9BASI|nr:uncharacterized protein UBRO_20508 [Ustilago bromivora]